MSLVSVVVPTFNNRAHVVETLKSVLAQTYEELEVVVSDHGSTDGTWQVLQRFAGDPRVRLHRITPGGGAGRNWNAATDLARGTFIKLLCADDLLRPECVSEQVEAMRNATTEAVMVASQRDVIDTGGRTMLRARGLADLDGEVASGAVARAAVRAGTNVLGEPACVLMRRHALTAAGGWDGRDGYVIDLRTYMRVLEQGTLVAVRSPLAAFRVSRQQWSYRLRREQAEQVERLFQDMGERWPGHVGRADLRAGRRRARLASVQRRILYAAVRGE